MSHFIYLLTVAFAFISINADAAPIPASEIQVTDKLLIDLHATPETKALYVNMQQLAKTNLLYGVQRPFTRGYHKFDNKNYSNSDTKEIVGDNPGVVGLDFLSHTHSKKKLHLTQVGHQAPLTRSLLTAKSLKLCMLGEE
ncbi:MAG: hypothetical protein AAGA18_11965 [Verrucomicrobiota bacterium]